jgi:hypothetical protein
LPLLIVKNGGGLMAIPAEGIINIEIVIEGGGISSREIDHSTRELAAELRGLPHESVGIITDQACEHTATETTPIATQGAVAMSLRKTILPRVIDLLQTGSFFASTASAQFHVS